MAAGAGRLRAVRRIDPDIVAAAVMVEEAGVGTQMPLEIAAVHAERRRDDASRRSSFAREARSARNEQYCGIGGDDQDLTARPSAGNERSTIRGISGSAELTEVALSAVSRRLDTGTAVAPLLAKLAHTPGAHDAVGRGTVAFEAGNPPSPWLQWASWTRS